MAKNTLPKYTQDMYNNEKPERILEIVPNKLKSFRNHPFKVQMDDEVEKLCTSIKHYGVLTPLIAHLISLHISITFFR